MKRLLAKSGAALAAILLPAAACSTLFDAPDDVAARVNGEPILASELERRYAQGVAGADPRPTDQEAEDLKLQLLSDMISNTILFQLADADNLTATDEEVEAQFEEFRSQYPPERFEELLAEQMITVEELRAEMRQTLTIEKLINKEITSKIVVSPAEIEAFYDKNLESFNLPARYHFAHILVTPSVDQGINNQEGDDAATPQQAVEKADRLLVQVQSGESFETLAQRFSEDPSTAMDGGDLGFQPADAISALDERLLDAVLEMKVGESLPRVVTTRFGYHIVKLIEKDEGGQKHLSDPGIESQIRQTILNARDQTLRGAFYETARNRSTVENFFARRLLERAGAP